MQFEFREVSKHYISQYVVCLVVLYPYNVRNLIFLFSGDNIYRKKCTHQTQRTTKLYKKRRITTGKKMLKNREIFLNFLTVTWMGVRDIQSVFRHNILSRYYIGMRKSIPPTKHDVRFGVVYYMASSLSMMVMCHIDGIVGLVSCIQFCYVCCLSGRIRRKNLFLICVLMIAFFW